MWVGDSGKKRDETGGPGVWSHAEDTGVHWRVMGRTPPVSVSHMDSWGLEGMREGRRRLL